MVTVQRRDRVVALVSALGRVVGSGLRSFTQSRVRVLGLDAGFVGPRWAGREKAATSPSDTRARAAAMKSSCLRRKVADMGGSVLLYGDTPSLASRVHPEGSE